MLAFAPPPVGACCVCAWPPTWWGVLCSCVPPRWWGVLRWVVAPLMVECAVLVRGPPLCGACCVGACPPPWWCVVWFGGLWPGLSSSVGWIAVAVVLVAWLGLVLCWCVPPPLLGPAVFVRGPPLWWGVLCRRVRVSVRGVVAGSMLGLFRWFAVVSAAVRPVLSGPGCLWCLPGRDWCCTGAFPPPCWGVLCLCGAPTWQGVLCLCVHPPWWGLRCWFVAPLMVGCAVLVCGLPLGEACCVDACPPRWWWLAWVVVVCWVGCGCGCVVCFAGVGAVLVRAPPPVGACRVCAWPPPWWGVLCRCVWVSVPGVVAGSILGLFCWFGVVSAAVRPAL